MAQAIVIVGLAGLGAFLWWDQVTRRGTTITGFAWWTTAVAAAGVGMMMLDAPRAPWFLVIGLPALVAVVFYALYFVFARVFRSG